MLTHDAKWLLDRAMGKAKKEGHEMLVVVFNRTETELETEVLCSMKKNPELLRQMVQQTLRVVVAAPQAPSPSN